MDLSLTLSSGSKAAEKFTGEASLGGESVDEDLLTGERERVDSLVSSNPLALLTGVLDHLTGVLGRLSGVLGGVLGLLGVVSSSLGAGTVDCAAGMAWASETAIPWSIRRCIKVHMDMKSINVAWLIALGIDGKRGLLTPVKMDESCPADGVFPAGVPWAAGPSNARVWWCAGPATPAGSSSWSAGPSVADCWLAGSSLVISCWPITCWPVICWAVICWTVTCQVVICRAVTCRAVICWPVHSLSRTRHCRWVVHFSCRFFHVFWPGRQRNHRDGSSLWCLGNGRGQL